MARGEREGGRAKRLAGTPENTMGRMLHSVESSMESGWLARWAGALERENANRGMPHQDAPSNRIERRIDLDSSGDCSLSKILVSMSAKCLAPVEPSLIFQ